MSNFNPEVFLNQQNTKTLETNYTAIPADEYMAVIEKVEADITKKTQSPFLRVKFKLIGDKAEELKARLGFRDPSVSQMYMLDLDSNGSLDDGPNKNVRLGQLRSAAGQNNPGEPWAPRSLEGAGPFRVQVGQRPDDDDPNKIYNDVKSVAKA
jgi:hypothetical protein